MDPITFYRLGQIRHQEILQEAEHQQHEWSLRTMPTLWERVRAHLSAGRIHSPVSDACQTVTRCDTVAVSR